MSDLVQVILIKKYAQAFINQFIGQLNHEEMAKIEKFISFIRANRQVIFYGQLLFGEKFIRRQAFINLLTNFELNKAFEKLIILLVEHNRLILLADILERIIKLFKDNNNEADFVITSSHNLDTRQLDQIIKFLTEQTGKKINIKTIIDKKLIVGLKIYSDTLGWEYSIRNQLNSLSHIV